MLLVEDDASIGEMYKLRLEGEGWEVHHVRDGDAAVAWLGEHPLPRAVLLDVMLPGRNGISVLEDIRAQERTRDLTVLIVSNSPGLGGPLERAQELGVAGWRIKSQLTPTALAAELKRLVGAP